jgi:predicted ATP-grasp superfamily ATP-dependent carboligase
VSAVPALSPELALTILGASARAAAVSARRAGLSVYAGDLFADVDLTACCPSVRVSVYPDGLLDVLTAAPAGPWMYTGAIENYPQLVERMAALRPLWGCGAECLRGVRNPLVVGRALERHDVPSPRVSDQPADVPIDGSWLVKPRRSAGGHGIAIWRGGALPERGVYFQQRIAGDSCGAVYLASRGRAILLGVTRQLRNRDSENASPFRYAGSVGPLTLDVEVRAKFERLGEALAAEFPLVGLFGVDVVVADGVPWPVEVNPRYTASVELLERAAGRWLLADHALVCEGGEVPKTLQPFASAGSPSATSVWAKRIAYAPRDVEIGAEAARFFLAALIGTAEPLLADIPTVGSRIEAGRPVLTVFGHGSDAPDAICSLDEQTATVERVIFGR